MLGSRTNISTTCASSTPRPRSRKKSPSSSSVVYHTMLDFSVGTEGDAGLTISLALTATSTNSLKFPAFDPRINFLRAREGWAVLLDLVDVANLRHTPPRGSCRHLILRAPSTDVHALHFRRKVGSFAYRVEKEIERRFRWCSTVQVGLVEGIDRRDARLL